VAARALAAACDNIRGGQTACAEVLFNELERAVVDVSMRQFG
jgi:hypothetical protein